MQITSFDELHLSPEVMKGIAEMGWETPTPIQAQAMGFILDGRDVIAQAQTGTGKTAAYGIPMIELIDPTLKSVQGLILVPTRELAIQIADHLTQLAKYRGTKILALYGGEPIQYQTKALKQGTHIVVGTPGRILDHIAQASLNLRKIKMVILDEADRMLDMGFIDDIHRILNATPRKKQVALFSATLNHGVTQISSDFMHYPEKVIVSGDEITLPQIEQRYIDVEARDKLRALTVLLDDPRVTRAIIFCKTQRTAQSLARNLTARRYDAETLHGGLTQEERDSVTDKFRRGKLRILVATDVAARGLDIQDVTHIINHNIPEDPTAYFHRIGRTARMLAEGTAISLTSPEEKASLNKIIAMTNTKITPLEVKYTANESAAEPMLRCAKCGAQFKSTLTPAKGQLVYCPRCYKKHQKTKSRSRRPMKY
jgi:ATP-dependent RNA helicase DeaD